jgi:hypothetical protein
MRSFTLTRVQAVFVTNSGWIEMGIVKFELRHSHRNNIARYERLLKTYLTDIERNYVEMRISEEQAALRLADQPHTIRRR